MVWIILLFLIIAIAIVLKILFGSKKFTGFLGEQDVRVLLNELDEPRYLVLHNLMIPGDTSTGALHINHTVVFPGGIIAIEVKNWSGRIHGKGDDKQWTAVAGRYKKRVENPILHNRENIAALRQVLGRNIPMYNIIVFNGRADLKIRNVTGACVIYSHRLIEVIKSIKDEEFSEVQVDALYKQLQTANIDMNTQVEKNDHNLA